MGMDLPSEETLASLDSDRTVKYQALGMMTPAWNPST